MARFLTHALAFAIGVGVGMVGVTAIALYFENGYIGDPDAD